MVGGSCSCPLEDEGKWIRKASLINRPWAGNNPCLTLSWWAEPSDQTLPLAIKLSWLNVSTVHHLQRQSWYRNQIILKRKSTYCNGGMGGEEGCPFFSPLVQLRMVANLTNMMQGAGGGRCEVGVKRNSME